MLIIDEDFKMFEFEMHSIFEKNFNFLRELNQQFSIFGFLEKRFNL